MNIEKQDVVNVLKMFRHPDYQSDLVTLKMVSHININGTTINLELYTEKNDPSHKEDLKNEVKSFLESRGLKVQSISFTDTKPTSDPAHKSPFEDQKKLPGIKHIIAVASGKGGVGKSTVSTNLAVALAKAGYQVGLMDADIYGPSTDMMMGVQGEKPTTPDGKRITPIEKHGVKIMTMGFLTDPDMAVIWRGPMLMKAVNQFLNDVVWGELDYLIVDLPPGTGDIQLTLTQEVPLSGAVVVTTPQDVALADVRRGVRMFEKVNVPVLGIVENMSFYSCPSCGHEDHIFGHNGGDKMADQLDVPLIGKIPLDPSVLHAGDSGKPIYLKDEKSKHADVFNTIVKIITDQA
mgnify:CR=1 FL=1